jgi:hypothetical protein
MQRETAQRQTSHQQGATAKALVQSTESSWPEEQFPMEIRFKYFWIAFIVGFALLGLAILCRAASRRGVVRRPNMNKPQKGRPNNDVGDEASIDSESSETIDVVESASATVLSRWFRRSMEKAAVQGMTAHGIKKKNHYRRTTGISPSGTLATITSRQEDMITGNTHGSSHRRVNQCASARSLAAVTPRISPDNPLHSQRGLHRGKFTFDEPPLAESSSMQELGTTAEGKTATGSAEIVRSRTWEQSIRRWTSIILATNAEAPDQSETIV